MSLENKKTLEIYDKKATTYINTGKIHDDKDPEKAMKKAEKLQKLIKESFKSIPKGGTIFEIGAATGENSRYMHDLGYNVTGSDVAKDFLEAIKNQGIPAQKFNVLEDEFKCTYNAIFAWRVFVHFTLEDIEVAFKNIYNGLEENGKFLFNVMNREIRDRDEEWVDFSNEYHMDAKRYYHYFSEKEISKIAQNTGFEITSITKEGGENNNKWLIYLLNKKIN